MLVAEATDGRDPDLVIAAFLHDAIEDQEVPRAVIAEAFGEDVAKLVEEVTDDKNLEKQERKRLQVEHSHKKSDRAKILKLPDKTSNLRAIAASPPPDWSVKLSGGLNTSGGRARLPKDWSAFPNGWNGSSTKLQRKPNDRRFFEDDARTGYLGRACVRLPWRSRSGGRPNHLRIIAHRPMLGRRCSKSRPVALRHPDAAPPSKAACE
jgi:hypothetical protein